MSDQQITPARVQLRRTKGWRMPPNAVKVCRPGRWGNPWRVGADGVPSAAVAVDLYRDWIRRPAQAGLRAQVGELRGKHLACWCRPGEPCHADVLLALANG